MTITQLRHRIEFWQKKLKPLGVDHWWIDRISIVQDPGGNPNSGAAVHTSNDYDRCSFEFAKETIETIDPRELDRTIIHEWLHVAMRDVDSAQRAAEAYLAPQTWEVLDDRFDHEKEGLVERLSFLIEQLHRA